MRTIQSVDSPHTKPCPRCSKRVTFAVSGDPRRHDRKGEPGNLCTPGAVARAKPGTDPSAKPIAPPRDECARSIPLPIRRWVLRRDRERCVRCGQRGPELEFHHVIEWALGGTHDPDNIDTLCSACHAEWTWAAPAGDVTYEEWKKTPPGRWFEGIIAVMMRDTPEGIGLLLDLAKMNALDFIDLMNRRRKEQLE